MRNLLTFILIVLLPLQSISAVAAACDGREFNPQEAQQYGQHGGFYHDEVSEVVVKDGGTAEPGDADHCHGHFTAALVMAGLTIEVLPGTRLSARRTRVDWLTPSLSPPERPQWARHA